MWGLLFEVEGRFLYLSFDFGVSGGEGRFGGLFGSGRLRFGGRYGGDIIVVGRVFGSGLEVILVRVGMLVRGGSEGSR